MITKEYVERLGLIRGDKIRIILDDGKLCYGMRAFDVEFRGVNKRGITYHYRDPHVSVNGALELGSIDFVKRVPDEDDYDSFMNGDNAVIDCEDYEGG